MLLREPNRNPPPPILTHLVDPFEVSFAGAEEALGIVRPLVSMRRGEKAKSASLAPAKPKGYPKAEFSTPRAAPSIQQTTVPNMMPISLGFSHCYKYSQIKASTQRHHTRAGTQTTNTKPILASKCLVTDSDPKLF